MVKTIGGHCGPMEVGEGASLKASKNFRATRGMLVRRGRGRSVRRGEAPTHSQLDLEHDVSEASPLPTNSKRFCIRLHQGLPLPEIIYIYSGFFF